MLAGAGVGATAGAVAAAPTGELASPVTVPLGAALGMAGGLASGVALEYGDKIKAAGRKLINIIVAVGAVLAGGAGKVDDSTHAPDGVSAPPIEAPATPPAGTKDTSGTTRRKERPSGE